MCSNFFDFINCYVCYTRLIMENKKPNETAVEWLEEQFVFFLKDIIENKNNILCKNLFEQAKQMEKEQIEGAYDNGGDHYTETGKAIWGKDYYKETYGQ